MVRRLLAGGHDCVVYDQEQASAEALTEPGAVVAASLAELAAALTPPRKVWIMVPDKVVDRVVAELAQHLHEGDVVIDGGNSYFPDDIRRAEELAQYGIEYVDVGTSGGVWGLKRGYCLMIGGHSDAVEQLEPVFRTLAPGPDAAPRSAGLDGEPRTAELGYLHCGGHGAGHFVKMVHNGIEYGMMAAFSEGFGMFNKAAEAGSPVKLEAPVDDIAELWRRGSVVSSWLLDLAAVSLREDPSLDAYSGEVSDSGEGRWTVKTATDMGIPAHVLTAALYQRFSSRGEATYANKLLSALRHAFGGHGEGP